MTHTHPVAPRTVRLGSGWVSDPLPLIPGSGTLKIVGWHITQLLGVTSQPETGEFDQYGNTVYWEEFRTFP